MERISTRIADLLLKKHYIEKSEHSIYQYGMQVALEISWSFIASIIICYLCGTITEGIIFFLIFIPLRSYLGGLHMKSYWVCWICSIATLIFILTLVKYVTPHFFASWIILIVAIAIIFFEAKRDGKQDEENAYFFKKICVILFFIIVVCIAISVIGDFKKVFLIACTNALVAISKILEKRRKRCFGTLTVI